MQPQYIYFIIKVFSLAIFIVVFCIFSILVYKNKLSDKRKNIGLLLEEWIMEVILDENNTSRQELSIPGKIKCLLGKKIVKEVVLQELVKLKKSLSGMPGENVQKLYEQLGLDSFSRQLMSSRKWHIKVKGIQELAIMNQYCESVSILNLTNHSHPIVRMEAQTAIVHLQKYKGLSFLNTLTYPLTEWHQVNLLQLLAQQPLVSVPGISNWLQSCNASVVQFALKLIGEQHAEEFCGEVINLLYDNNINVRRCAILCLGEILSGEAIDALKKHFPNEKIKELKLCIISQLQKSNMESEFQFFLDLQLNKDTDIKLASHNTILDLLKNRRPFLAA